MIDRLPVVTIPKEKAVFRMDARGYWRNSGGRFRVKKIIDHFHTSIAKDEDGYYVSQIKEDVIEKVYFPYEDTALFVFDIEIDDGAVTLVLNTKARIRLDPDRLYTQNDSLYTDNGDDRIKFSERALMKIAGCLDDDGESLFFCLNGRRHEIRQET